MLLVSSRAIMMWMVTLAAATLLGACGYLDDDIGLSDEEFEASLGSSGHGSGGTISLGSGYGCGIRGTHASHAHHSAHHPSIGRLITSGHPGTTVIDMSPSHISGRYGSSNGIIVGRASEDENNEEEASDAPIYAAGELETWGDYLEAELQRGQSGRSAQKGRAQ